MSSPTPCRTRSSLALGLALALAAGAAHAAERPFCADRPGKATPPCVLDVGRWQLEAAPADATFDHGDDAYAVAGFEVRHGVMRRTEVSAAWTPLSIGQLGGRTVSGTGDLQLGLRTALTDPDSDGPAAALEAFVSAPTATRHQGAGGWQGGVLVPMATPAAPFSLGFAPEVDVVRDADGHGAHLAWSAAASLGRSFGPLTAGVELWGRVDDDPAGRTAQASADLTAAYAPPGDPELQLDAGLNAGLNRRTPDLEVYVGVARRF